ATTETYPLSLHDALPISGGKISQIVSLQDNTARSQYQLEPQLITAISGSSREKRRMVRFHDMPEVLVHAVTAAEDKRFFQHAGRSEEHTSELQSPCNLVC